MEIFSKGFEERVMTWLSDFSTRFFRQIQKQKPRATGLIEASDLKDELNIKGKTLRKWEKAGLRKYQPPLEDTKKTYYKISDILLFMGVNDV